MKRAEEAKRSDNRTAANLLGGTRDLVLALTGVAGGLVYAGMNGVVAGLSASTEIAGSLAS